MVFSHKFTNNQYPISTLWRVVNSLLTSKPRCQSGPGVGRNHASSKKQVRVANFEPFGDILSVLEHIYAISEHFEAFLKCF